MTSSQTIVNPEDLCLQYLGQRILKKKYKYQLVIIATKNISSNNWQREGKIIIMKVCTELHRLGKSGHMLQGDEIHLIKGDGIIA